LVTKRGDAGSRRLKTGRGGSVKKKKKKWSKRKKLTTEGMISKFARNRRKFSAKKSGGGLKLDGKTKGKNCGFQGERRCKQTGKILKGVM